MTAAATAARMKTARLAQKESALDQLASGEKTSVAA